MNSPKFSALIAVLTLSLITTSANAAKFLVSFKEQTRAQAFKALIQDQTTGMKLDADLSDVKVLIVKAKTQEQILKYVDAKDLNVIEKQTTFAPPRVELAVMPTSGLPRMTLMSDELPASKGLKMLKVPEAWGMTRGKGARVMVIDSGIDKNHPAFAGRIEQMKNFTEDGDPNDATDTEGHGTHVAGIIGGRTSVEANGVAPDVTFLIAKVCGAKGCTNDAVAKALGWAYREKVDVVNMSLGGGGSVVERYMINMLDGEQVPVVAAMGNNGMEATPLPAGYPSVEAVGAVDFNGQRAAFSNWSPALDVMAPGVAIRSSVPRGMGRDSVASFQTEEGTFQALPSVTFTGVPTGALNQSAVFADYGTTDDLSKVAVAGKILVVRRGNLPLLDKIKNAVTAGAAAIIIANNDSALVSGSLTDEAIKIPVIMVETKAGENLIINLMKSPGLNVRVEVQASDYAEFSGTSMASPYVAGVAALMRATVPGLTAWKLRQIMEGTATPIKTDIPNQTGKGLVNAKAAVDGAYAVRKKYKKIQ